MRRTMQAFGAELLVQASEEAVIGDLTSGLTATFSYRKSRYCGNAIPRLTQRIERFRQSKPQWAHHSRGHDCDSFRGFLSGRTT
jgi:hypothetical protein